MSLQRVPLCQPVVRTVHTPRRGRRENAHSWSSVCGSNRSAYSPSNFPSQAFFLFQPTVHGNLRGTVHSIVPRTTKVSCNLRTSFGVRCGTGRGPRGRQPSRAPEPSIQMPNFSECFSRCSSSSPSFQNTVDSHLGPFVDGATDLETG